MINSLGFKVKGVKFQKMALSWISTIQGFTQKMISKCIVSKTTMHHPAYSQHTCYYLRVKQRVKVPSEFKKNACRSRKIALNNSTLMIQHCSAVRLTSHTSQFISCVSLNGAISMSFKAKNYTSFFFPPVSS